MPITYMGMNDKPIKVIGAIFLVVLLLLVIWGIGIFSGVLPSTLSEPFLPSICVGSLSLHARLVICRTLTLKLEQRLNPFLAGLYAGTQADTFFGNKVRLTVVRIARRRTTRRRVVFVVDVVQPATNKDVTTSKRTATVVIGFILIIPRVLPLHCFRSHRYKPD
jgi:hypothetical protein